VFQNGTLHFTNMRNNGTIGDSFWIHKPVSPESDAPMLLLISAVLSISIVVIACGFVFAISKHIGKVPPQNLTSREMEEVEAREPLQTANAEQSNSDDEISTRASPTTKV